jgi:hypothetical protein
MIGFGNIRAHPLKKMLAKGSFLSVQLFTF